MKSSNRLTQSLRRLFLAQLCLVLAPFTFAQNAASSLDAASAKYDLNRDGRLDANETAAMQADQARAASAVTTTAAGESAPGKDVVELSPFTVTADNNGYYSSNTMSGTRFNSKIEDLASSISIMTKEQMSDFAMLDINDVFLYTASAEGTGTYTDLTVDRNGSVSDNVQLNPQQANRVRGLAPANISMGNYETMGRVPVDPIAIDAVEISRGPNANVFGLGNPSGTLNQVPSSANLQRNRAQVSLRADSYDGYRGTLDINRVLIEDKLALRFSTVYQHEGFVRKPSGVDTERYNGMIKYQPFKNTTLSASTSYFHQYGVRPNFSPPRDSISFWIASGRPTWDPVTSQVHLNGATVGTFTNNTNLPAYFNNGFTGSGRNYLYIDQGGVAYWTVPSGFSNTVPLAGATTAGPTSAGQAARYMSPTAAAGLTLGRFTGQPLFITTPTVDSQDIYDWTSVNLGAVNNDWDRALTSNVQLEQVFIKNPTHLLVGQLGWFREESERFRHDYIGIRNDNGQSGQLLIDVNERLLDGTANPFFLRPYIGQDQPRSTYEPAKWDTYRGQVAYKLDLTQKEGWAKNLGVHTVNGYYEYKYRINRRYSYRDSMLGPVTWIPNGLTRGNQGATTNVVTGLSGAPLNITRSYLRYYVGDNQGNDIDYAPTEFAGGSFPFVWGNTATNAFVRDPIQLGTVAVTDSTGAGSNTKVVLKTLGGVVQSHFWDGRIVTTFGLREDQQYFKSGSTPTLLNADGVTFNYQSLDGWQPTWRLLSGKTKQGGVVARPFRDLGFVNRMRESNGAGRFFGGLLNGLSLTYNKSDSFVPQNPAINLQQQEIPNPVGEGEDYGFGLNMFDGKLVLRVNHYDNTQINKSGGDAGTIAQRVTRIDLTSNAAFLLVTQAAGTPTLPGWIRSQNPGFSEAQVQAELARQIGVPTELNAALFAQFAAGTLSSTQDLRAKGNEIELNYNPTKFWTITGSFTETESINSNVSKDINDWIEERMPIWTTIQDPRGPDHIWGNADDSNVAWWTQNYGGSQTAQQNYIAFVQTPFSVIKQLEGKSNPQIRRYESKLSTRYQLAAISDNRFLKNLNVGGSWRWQDKGAIGYYGVQSLPAEITDLDANRPIYDKAHNFFDLFFTYKTKLWNNKVGASFQLNVRNVLEGGYLQPIGAFPDGTPHSYRIVDPRQFILTATFDL